MRRRRATHPSHIYAINGALQTRLSHDVRQSPRLSRLSTNRRNHCSHAFSSASSASPADGCPRHCGPALPSILDHGTEVVVRTSHGRPDTTRAPWPLLTGNTLIPADTQPASLVRASRDSSCRFRDPKTKVSVSAMTKSGWRSMRSLASISSASVSGALLSRLWAR